MLAAADNYGYVYVFGTLRTLGTAEDPVTITSHNAEGGAPADGYGFGLTVQSGVDQPVTSLQYAHINNLNYNGLNTVACSPIIEQCRIEAYGNVYLTILNGGPQIRNCAFDHVYLHVRSMSAAFPSLEVKDNRFYNLTSSCVAFRYSESGTLLAEQITNNSFASANPQVELDDITDIAGTGDVKLGGNYWGQDTAPLVNKENGTVVGADFTPLLTAAPANIGPSW